MNRPCSYICLICCIWTLRVCVWATLHVFLFRVILTYVLLSDIHQLILTMFNHPNRISGLKVNVLSHKICRHAFVRINTDIVGSWQELSMAQVRCFFFFRIQHFMLISVLQFFVFVLHLNQIGFYCWICLLYYSLLLLDRWCMGVSFGNSFGIIGHIFCSDEYIPQLFHYMKSFNMEQLIGFYWFVFSEHEEKRMRFSVILFRQTLSYGCHVSDLWCSCSLLICRYAEQNRINGFSYEYLSNASAEETWNLLSSHSVYWLMQTMRHTHKHTHAQSLCPDKRARKKINNMILWSTNPFVRFVWFDTYNSRCYNWRSRGTPFHSQSKRITIREIWMSNK